MPMKSFTKVFYFNLAHQALAERFRWRVKHSENTENAVELGCHVDTAKQIQIEVAFQSRRQMDWADGFARGLIELEAYPESPSRCKPISAT